MGCQQGEESPRGCHGSTNFNLDGSRARRVAAASTPAPTLAPPAPAPAEPPGQHLDSPPLPELDWHDCGNETLTGVPRSMAIGTNWTAKALFAVSRLGAPLAQLPGLARLIGLVQFPGKKAKVGHLAVLAQVAGADDAILYRLASTLFNMGRAGGLKKGETSSQRLPSACQKRLRWPRVAIDAVGLDEAVASPHPRRRGATDLSGNRNS